MRNVARRLGRAVLLAPLASFFAMFTSDTANAATPHEPTPLSRETGPAVVKADTTIKVEVVSNFGVRTGWLQRNLCSATTAKCSLECSHVDQILLNADCSDRVKP